MTAGEAWARIQHRYMAAPPADTVDTLKGGDPATPVTGIVTTFLDTMDVLREAVRLGDNLVISHEPTFYNHVDDTKPFTDDPVYKEKIAYIEQHHLVVYRLHDEIHQDPHGDHILMGVYEALGWSQYPQGKSGMAQHMVTIPATTLGELAQTLQKGKLQAQTMRVEGDPAQAVTHVAVFPGASGLEKHVRALNSPGVEVLIAGEVSEWETVEYVRDAVAQGREDGHDRTGARGVRGAGDGAVCEGTAGVVSRREGGSCAGGAGAVESGSPGCSQVAVDENGM